MNIAKQSVAVNGRLIRMWLVAGAVVLCAPVASRAINAVAPAAGAVQQGATAVQPTLTGWHSPGVADIVKLVDAKVDPTVIQTYVKNSPTAYNPSATEIIALKDRGVGPEILTAMLQRGAEVRAQSMRAAQAAPNAVAPQNYPGVANPYPPAPTYGYGSQPVYSDSTYSYPASSYAYPYYSYGYPDYNYGYGYYGCAWPYYWPGLSFSFGGYRYGGYCGYRYPYWGGGNGRGYYGGNGYGSGRGSWGGQGNWGGHGSSGWAGYHGQGGRSASFAGSSAGMHSSGGFSGHSASFAGHSGGFGGGHASGRGR